MPTKKPKLKHRRSGSSTPTKRRRNKPEAERPPSSNPGPKGNTSRANTRAKAVTINASDRDVTPVVPDILGSTFSVVPDVATSMGMKTYARTLGMLRRDPTLTAPIRYVIPGMAARGYCTMMAAREKLGKSTIMASLASEVSRGGTIWGEPVEQARVLWVGLEEPLPLAVQRFGQMGGDDDHLVVLDRLRGEGGLAQLIAEIEAARADLVILDSLAAYAKGVEDENSAAACTALLTPLVQYVHENNIALVMLHHSNKQGGGYRGSVAIGASVDMILEMREGSESPTSRRIEARGRFNAPSFTCSFDPESLTWTMDGAPLSAEERQALLCGRIETYLRQYPNRGKADIREAMACNARATDLAIDALVAAGRVVHHGQRTGYTVAPPAAG